MSEDSKKTWMTLIEYGIYSIISLIIFAGFHTVGKLSLILGNISQLNSASTALLGFLGTILTIIYTFKSSFEENQAVKSLNRTDGFKYILETLTGSVLLVLVVWIFSLIFSIFQVSKLLGKNSTLLAGFIIIFFVVSMSGKVLKSIFLFKLLGDAFNHNE